MIRFIRIPLLSLFLFFGYNGAAVPAEPNPPNPDDGRKIVLEKAQIIGAVERPGTFYFIPWRSPETQDKVNFEFSRDFKKEIFEFIDRNDWRNDSVRRPHGGTE